MRLFPPVLMDENLGVIPGKFSFPGNYGRKLSGVECISKVMIEDGKLFVTKINVYMFK